MTARSADSGLHVPSEGRGVEVGIHVDAAEKLEASPVAAQEASARAVVDLLAVDKAHEGLHGGAPLTAARVALAVGGNGAGVATRHGTHVARKH